jgi:hypothetical protein
MLPMGVAMRVPSTAISAPASSMASTWARQASAPWIMASGRERGTSWPSGR